MNVSQPIPAPHKIKSEVIRDYIDVMDAPFVRDFLDASASPSTSWRTIVSETCNKYGVSKFEALGSGRVDNVVRARHEIFYRMSKECGISFAKIGRLLGDRDHTVIRFGVIRHIQRIEESK